MIAICRWFCGPEVLKGLLMVPVGTMGSFYPAAGPFETVWEIMGFVQS